MLPSVVLFIFGKNWSSKALPIFLMGNFRKTEPNIVLISHLTLSLEVT